MTINLEAWQAVGGAIGILIVGVYGRWEQRKTRATAQKAVDQTVATGNGFAKSVKDSLERIEQKIDHHIETHADADVKRGASK